MTKVSKSPRHREAPAPATRAAARVAPRRKIADRRLLDFGAADQRALDRAYRACRAVDGPAGAAGQRGDARQPREGPEGNRSRPKMAQQGLEKIESAGTPWTYKIRYSRTNRISGHARCERNPFSCSQWRALGSDKGNFPPRNPLKFLKTWKESRNRRRWSVSRRRSADRSRRTRPRAKSKGNFPLRKPLKFLESGSPPRFCREGPELLGAMDNGFRNFRPERFSRQPTRFNSEAYTSM
jgi:hypothetical protein